MRILLTGASSFTGYWFACKLAEAGHDLTCPLRGPGPDGTGLRACRLGRLDRDRVRLIPNAPFGSPAFLDLCRSEPHDLLCHHGAEVTDYKSADFDANRALVGNTRNLRTVLETLQHHALKAVVLTGTVFEQDEGRGTEPLRAFSPYGLSKGLTWQVFRYYCADAQIALGKFVIPNPFGPLEEPRFTAHLMSRWRGGQAATVRTPDYVRDNVHVDLLALCYRAFVERMACAKQPADHCHPSGYREKQGAFARRVAAEVQRRSVWKCELDLAIQEDFPEPRERTNFESAIALAPDWNEAAAWDSYVKFYQS